MSWSANAIIAAVDVVMAAAFAISVLARRFPVLAFICAASVVVLSAWLTASVLFRLLAG